jgi:cell wall assembly regulator SMI1
MSDALAGLWDRFEGWLEEHAPADRQVLLPGASDGQIRALERGLGFALHPDLAWLLRRHNGVIEPRAGSQAGAFLLDYWLLDTQGVLERRRDLVDICRDAQNDVDEDAVIGKMAHPRWVPFATCFSADILFVDHREGEHYGQIGEMSFGDPIYRLLWDNQQAMMQDVNRAIQDGSPITSIPRAPVVGGAHMLTWRVVL